MAKIIQGNFGPKRPAGLPTGDMRTPESKKLAEALIRTRDEDDMRRFGAPPQAGNPDPGDPRQPSPPTLQALPEPKVPVLLDPVTGESVVLTAAQQKAVAFILSGKTFVFVAMEPTATGSDFFTAVHGDHSELRNAEEHLGDVIHRALIRNGVLQ